MRHLLSQRDARTIRAELAGTIFCESCNEVCAPECRREALLDRNPDYWHPHTFSTAWLGRSWLDSLLWTPRTLAIVLPLALLGLVAVRNPWGRCLLAAWMLGPPIFYSFYWYTAIHPRFLWPSLPALFVLSAAGVSALARLRPIARAAPRPAPRRP